MHCRNQLGELGTSAWQFRRLNIPLIAVSADNTTRGRDMELQIAGAFPIACDDRLTLVTRLGLTDHDPNVDHSISRPAAFGVGSSGRIEYCFVGRSEKDRPSVALLLLAAERLASARV